MTALTFTDIDVSHLDEAFHRDVTNALGVESLEDASEYLNAVWSAVLQKARCDMHGLAELHPLLWRIPYPDSFGSEAIDLSADVKKTLFSAALDSASMTPARFAACMRSLMPTRESALDAYECWLEDHRLRLTMQESSELADAQEYWGFLLTRNVMRVDELDKWSVAELNPPDDASNIQQDIESELIDGVRKRVWAAPSADDNTEYLGYEALQQEWVKREANLESELAAAEEARKRYITEAELEPVMSERQQQAIAALFESYAAS